MAGIGALRYQASSGELQYSNGTDWKALSSMPLTGGPGSVPYWNGTQWIANSTNFYNNGSNIGVGTTNPLVRLDARAMGSPEGAIGVGTSVLNAGAAGAGALRYQAGVGLLFSDGSNWNTLATTSSKAFVSGYFTGNYGINAMGPPNRTEVEDVNSDFSPAGVFIAPRDGNYAVAYSMSSTPVGDIAAGGSWEGRVVAPGREYIVRHSSALAQSTFAVSISANHIIHLTPGQTLTFQIRNLTGQTKTLDAPDYNRFSIAEL